VSRAKDKGRRAEHAIVKLHTDLGIEAERMPLSGSLGGKYKDDVLIANTVRAEVKSRKSGEGFKTLETWMKDCPIMFLKRDRVAPLVVMTAAMYAELALARWGIRSQIGSRTETQCDTPDTEGDSHA
jgi:Holliday junction resolvase